MVVSKELENTLKKAFDLAHDMGHEFVTTEHLLYAITFDAAGAEILRHCGVNIDELKKDLLEFLEDTHQKISQAGMDFEPQYSLGIQFVLQVAATHVHSSGKEKVTTGNVLVALFREQDCYAVYFLNKQGVRRVDVVNYISHGISKLESAYDQFETSDVENQEEDTAAPKKKSAAGPLATFCVNLKEKAEAGKIDPLIGRDKELERTIHILARRRKNNPIFVGDAGVGKTAIAEGLALRIHEGKVPEILKNTVIYSLDMGALLAGTKFRGEFEERLKAVVQALKNTPNAVVFIDEIHTIIGAGAVSGGALDASNLLKPALANGDIKCIGTTTYKEFRTIFEKDHALSRRFQKIEIEEPGEEDALEILQGLKHYYEEFHKVTYQPESIKSAVELSVKYINDRRLPDKAIDLLDEAGAEVKLRRQKSKQVTVKDIEELVARIAKIPPKTIKKDDKKHLKNLDINLKKKIFAQDDAIDRAVNAIRLSRSGLADPARPIASFLFAGPTGVGKTEVAKQLAEEMGVEFIRFDMSEYMEKHTVSRLIGSPPGYVGFDQGGQLTDAIHRNPHSVLLLDEIEKAHPDIFNILLQIMDHATLTDNNGRKSDFRQVVLIMTTNTGARESTAKPIGFEQNQQYAGRSMDAIKRTFSPEFINRLTAIITFAPLTLKTVEKIVQKELGRLQERLKDRQVTLNWTDATCRHLAQKGFDPLYGARPIQRFIEQEMAQPLSSEILFGKLTGGGTVTVKLRNKKLLFDYKPLDTPHRGKKRTGEKETP